MVKTFFFFLINLFIWYWLQVDVETNSKNSIAKNKLMKNKFQLCNLSASTNIFIQIPLLLWILLHQSGRSHIQQLGN